MSKKLLDDLAEFTQIYRDARQKYDIESEQYWDSLSYEDKLKAFYIVTKRIHKGDIIDNGSYRYVLYEVFGFDMDSYLVGRQYQINLIGFKGHLFFWNLYRFNSGYPYVCWRIGPILIKRYW